MISHDDATDTLNDCRRRDGIRRGLSQRLAEGGKRLLADGRQTGRQLLVGAERYARRQPNRAIVAALLVGSAVGLLVRRR